MIWRSPLAVLVLAGLLAPLCWAGLWLAGPVSAGSGVGCTGNTCSVLLSSLITLKGDAGNGTTHAQLPVAPPPCLWQPIGATTAGAIDVSECFDNAGSRNTSLVTGRIISDRVPADRHYYMNTDVMAKTNGRWTVISVYPVVYYPQAGDCRP